MLALRPVCEHCNKALPADSTDAMICTYECTFCQSCVNDVLSNVCPNCGGNFCPRPIRPRNKLLKDPASTTAHHHPVDLEAHARRVAQSSGVKPEDR